MSPTLDTVADAKTTGEVVAVGDLPRTVPTTSAEIANGGADAASPSAPLGDATQRMARPWRLGIIGIAIAVGLGTRLLAANKWFLELVSDSMLWVSALSSLLAGVGLLAVTQERDRFDRSLATLAVSTGAALAALQWISPHFAEGTTRWDDGSQVALGVLGLGNGILFAGVVALALVRRGPTLTAALLVIAGVSMLAGNTVALRSEWIAILLWAIAAGAVLLAWDRAPRNEPHYRPEQASPRVVRAILSFLILVLGGTAIQLWISRGETIGRAVPAIGVAVATIAVAFVSMVGLRRQLLNQTTTLSEWSSWMREIRTGELRSGFENLDDPGQLDRPLSFPDLRTGDFALGPEGAPVSAEVAAVATSSPSEFAMEWQNLEAPSSPDVDEAALTEAAPASTIPSADLPSPSQPAAPTFASLSVDLPSVDLPSVDLPSTDLPEVEVPQIELPTVDTVDRDAPSAPALTLPEAAPPEAVPPEAEPAAAAADEPTVAPLTWPGDSAESATAATASTFSQASAGIFSSWINADEADEPVPAPANAVAEWLAACAMSANPTVVAIELMSLAEFDELPMFVSGAMNEAVLALLSSLATPPAAADVVDGPYLMASFDHLETSDLGPLNAAIESLLADRIDTEHGAVGLDAAVAVLRLSSPLTFDELIDTAIDGLIRSRQMRQRIQG